MIKTILAIALLCVTLNAPAVTVDPFAATVTVPDRGEAARARAFDDALRQVLTKFSGSAALAALVSASNVESYVQQFRYLDKTDAVAGDEIALEVRFQREAIRDLARREGLGAWPTERGAVLPWVVIEQAGSRHLLGLGPNDTPLLNELRESAERRALPLIEPLLDLEDQMNVRPEAISGGFVEDLAQANARYEPSYVLYGRLSASFNGWRARYILDTGEELETWSTISDNIADLLGTGVDGAAERLAARFAVAAAATDDRLSLYVLGLRSALEYAFALDYLSSRSVVRSVRVARTDPLGVAFDLQVDGGPDALMRILANDRRLLREASTDPSRLVYRIDPNTRME